MPREWDRCRVRIGVFAIVNCNDLPLAAVLRDTTSVYRERALFPSQASDANVDVVDR